MVSRFSKKVYRPDIYQLAAQSLIDEKIIAKDEFPDFATEDGYKPAQTHFIDDIVYDGKQPNAYINKFEIGLKEGDKL